MPSAVLFGVPSQGSVLGPILFLLYTADLLQLVKRHHLTPSCVCRRHPDLLSLSAVCSSCFAALRQIRSVRRSLPQRLTPQGLNRTLLITQLDQCNSVLVVPLYTCSTDCSLCWMPSLGLSTRAGRQNTQLHYYRNFTGCVSRSKSSSGCVFRRTIPLCAWHAPGVPVRQPAANIRYCRSSMSPLCWHHDTTSAVDSSGYSWRPCHSGGCSAGIEQSATRDSGLL